MRHEPDRDALRRAARSKLVAIAAGELDNDEPMSEDELARHGFRVEVAEVVMHHEPVERMDDALRAARRHLDRRLAAPVRRPAPYVQRTTPGVRPRSRARRAPRATRAGPGDDDPEPAPPGSRSTTAGGAR